MTPDENLERRANPYCEFDEDPFACPNLRQWLAPEDILDGGEYAHRRFVANVEFWLVFLIVLAVAAAAIVGL
jgi:hypothetical protein